MDTSELDYDLPSELIAQHPPERRDASRLLVYDRSTGAVRHRGFAELPDELSGELAVVNDTRVVPARIRIERAEGRGAPARARGRRRVARARAPDAPAQGGRRYGAVELLEHLGEGRWRVRLDGEPDGEAPLPPYITEPLADPARYQTVYADEAGSAAAPTAGLHFTPELLGRLDVERVTLHVGLDTFRPLATDTLEAARAARRALLRRGPRRGSGSRLPSASSRSARPRCACSRRWQATDCYKAGRRCSSRPGFEFRRVDALLTNFHLPRSTLLALVMAFAGVEETRRLYRLAVEERYRFYSFGDAMLIL